MCLVLSPTDAAAIEAILNSPHLLPGTFNLAKGRKLHEARETLYQSPSFPAEQVRVNLASLLSVANVPQVFHAGLPIMKMLLTCSVAGHVSNAYVNFSEAWKARSLLLIALIYRNSNTTSVLNLFHITGEKQYESGISVAPLQKYS